MLSVVAVAPSKHSIVTRKVRILRAYGNFLKLIISITVSPKKISKSVYTTAL
jgi:hypothetical protein